jgi:hypothetical protein
MPRYVSGESPLTCHDIGDIHSRKALASSLPAYHGVELMIEQDGGYTLLWLSLTRSSPMSVARVIVIVDVSRKSISSSPYLGLSLLDEARRSPIPS